MSKRQQSLCFIALGDWWVGERRIKSASECEWLEKEALLLLYGAVFLLLNNMHSFKFS